MSEIKQIYMYVFHATPPDGTETFVYSSKYAYRKEDEAREELKKHKNQFTDEGFTVKLGSLVYAMEVK